MCLCHHCHGTGSVVVVTHPSCSHHLYYIGDLGTVIHLSSLLHAPHCIPLVAVMVWMVQVPLHTYHVCNALIIIITMIAQMVWVQLCTKGRPVVLIMCFLRHHPCHCHITLSCYMVIEPLGSLTGWEVGVVDSCVEMAQYPLTDGEDM